jgi:uncharacterized membrane protein
MSVARDLLRALAQNALAAARAKLAKVDPKVLASGATSAVTWLVVNVGLNVHDPLIAAAIPIVAGALAGFLTSNAASSLPNRWKAPTS